jgi:hypothetical protein
MPDDRAAITTLIASFDDPDAARAAMVDAELAGLDADDMHLQTLGSRTSTLSIERDGELDAMQDVVSRSFVGGAIGALVLAVLAAVVVLIIGPDRLAVALIIAALGGAIAGFLLGGFWFGAARLPANPEALDTYTVDPADEASVIVEFRLGGGRIEPARVEELCRKHGAVEVERRAA